MCYKCGLHSEDRNKIRALIKTAGSVIGVTPDSLDEIVEEVRKLVRVMQSLDHPINRVFVELRSSFAQTISALMLFREVRRILFYLPH